MKQNLTFLLEHLDEDNIYEVYILLKISN